MQKYNKVILYYIKQITKGEFILYLKNHSLCYIICLNWRTKMFLDSICTIIVVFLVNFLLLRKYINGYTKLNLVFILISVCGFSIYVYSFIKDVELYWYIQVILLVLMVVMPAFMYFLGNKDSVKDKSNYYLKVEKYLQDGNTNLARKYINKYLEENKEDSQTYYLLGMCEKMDKNSEAATSNFMKAIENDKNNYLAYFELGAILEEENKVDTAIVMLTNANKIKPDFYDAAELLGICYTAEKRYLEAEKVYLDALKYHENSYELNYNIAVVKLERGLIDEAEEYLIKATNLSDKPYGACYSLGNIYYKKGKYQNALENYKTARFDKNLTASSFYKMAIIYSLIREYENAIICLKYSIILDSKYMETARSELHFEKIIADAIDFDEKVKSLKGRGKKMEFAEKILECAYSRDFLNGEVFNSVLQM